MTLFNPMQITIGVKTVYGKEMIYPVDDLAKGFADLLGQKTLTRVNLAAIKAMGFKIEQVTQYVNL